MWQEGHMPKSLKKQLKNQCFSLLFEGKGLRGSVLNGLIGGLAVVLEGILQIMGVILWPTRLPKGQDHPFLGPSWAHLGPMSKHLGPLAASRWLSCVDVARSFLNRLIFPSVFDVEVGFVC